MPICEEEVFHEFPNSSVDHLSLTELERGLVKICINFFGHPLSLNQKKNKIDKLKQNIGTNREARIDHKGMRAYKANLDDAVSKNK